MKSYTSKYNTRYLTFDSLDSCTFLRFGVWGPDSLDSCAFLRFGVWGPDSLDSCAFLRFGVRGPKEFKFEI